MMPERGVEARSSRVWLNRRPQPSAPTHMKEFLEGDFRRVGLQKGKKLIMGLPLSHKRTKGRKEFSAIRKKDPASNSTLRPGDRRCQVKFPEGKREKHKGKIVGEGEKPTTSQRWIRSWWPIGSSRHYCGNVPRDSGKLRQGKGSRSNTKKRGMANRHTDRER